MNETNPMLANPMIQQMIQDPRAEQMKRQMMMILGGLGQQQVPPQAPGQVAAVPNQPMFGKPIG